MFQLESIKCKNILKMFCRKNPEVFVQIIILIWLQISNSKLLLNGFIFCKLWFLIIVWLPYIIYRFNIKVIKYSLKCKQMWETISEALSIVYLSLAINVFAYISVAYNSASSLNKSAFWVLPASSFKSRCVESIFAELSQVAIT